MPLGCVPVAVIIVIFGIKIIVALCIYHLMLCTSFYELTFKKECICDSDVSEHNSYMPFEAIGSHLNIYVQK